MYRERERERIYQGRNWTITILWKIGLQNIESGAREQSPPPDGRAAPLISRRRENMVGVNMVLV